VAVAVNGWDAPTEIEGLSGLIARFVGASVLAVSVVPPDVPLRVAVIVEVPAATPVASPAVDPVARIVALLVSDEDQVAKVVTLLVEPSL
jgi:hypothetical protein